MRSLALLCTLLSATALAETPGRLHVNGLLTGDNDAPVEGTHTVRFSLYAQDEEGTAFYEEELTIPFFQGAFFAELGDSKILDLNLFEPSAAGVWLGVSVDGSPELAPRIRMGSVPFAAYAHRAGTATVSDLAQDADALGGRPPEAYRLAEDKVPYAEISDLPAGLDDGDDDLFASLACGAGEVAVFNGEAWTCARPFAGKSCPEGQVAFGVDAAGELVCVPDRNTTYGGANFALSNQACPAGQVLQGIGVDGKAKCIADKDTNTTYKVAGGGLALSGTTLSMTACSAGQVLKSNGNGTYSCAADNNNTYSGANFALANKTCPSGEVMIGIKSDGNPNCSTAPIKDYVNDNCFLYAGWRDNCDACSSVTNYVRISSASCTADGGCITGTGGLLGASTSIFSRAGRLRLGGDVNSDDTFFFAFSCQ